MNLSLFAPEPLPLADKLRARLTELATQGVFLGTSSWKYPGWLGQIYDRDRYLVRGKFSQRKFDQECIAEYGQVFPIVCGDFSFYQFPAVAFWQKLFAESPPALRFAFKVPDELTVRVWPRHERYGPRGGQANENFLSASILETAFLTPLRPYRDRIAALIFEFTPMRSTDGFLDSLDTFLASLPGDFRFAVEIRNAELLGDEYLRLLSQRRVAHVFNAWTRMPEIGAQIRVPGAFTTDFTLVRALLRKGRPYEQAVEQFSPYQRVADPNPEGRAAIGEVIERARREKQPSYIFINNRFEGNAPGTMEAIVDAIGSS